MKKPILISGSHRSGTTWTGYVLSKAENVRYIHEPFNIGLKDRDKELVKYWFRLVEEDDFDYSKKVKSYIQSYYSPFSLVNIENAILKRKYKKLYYFLADLKGRFTDRTIIKDPIAIFSSAWFYNELNADVVILIRHPAAFIASLKVKNWKFDFNQLKLQPKLMNSFSLDQKEMIEEFVKRDSNIIEQGILLWNLIHFRILEFKTKFSDQWYFIRHEDLSGDPKNEFKYLCDFLNLRMTKEMLDYIEQTTTSTNQDDINRDSISNIKSWEKRLSKEEIELIKRSTEHIWLSFYNETDW